MAYTPQQNGKSERMNSTLLNKIRIKIIESGIPKYLWDEALKCSVYEINRTPSKAIPKGLTPAYIRHGHSDLEKLRIFGCRAWVTILPKGTKLDARSTRGVIVGYCGGGYRIWIPDENKIIKSRDIRFDESIMELKEKLISQENKTNLIHESNSEYVEESLNDGDNQNNEENQSDDGNQSNENNQSNEEN